MKFNPKLKTVILCEGESECLFLEYLIQNGKTVFTNKPTIIKFKGWNKALRIKLIKPGYEQYILIHDKDDFNQIKKYIIRFKKECGQILWNDPNFDIFCAEFLGLKYKKDDKKDALRKISEVIDSKKGKKINPQKLWERGKYKNIKNIKNFEIISVIIF